MLLIVLIASVYGLIIGSFLNAVVWRLHECSTPNAELKTKHKKPLVINAERLSITKGRSMCPECGHMLRAYDLIPVVSWLVLRGKCRDCHQAISWQYPVVEVLTAGLFGLSWLALQPSNPVQVVLFMIWLAILAMLIVLTIYDLRWMILPDVVVFPVMGLASVLVLASSLTNQSPMSLIGPMLAAVLAGGSFYALAAVSKGKWMGGGDIKLAFLMGLILGLPKLALAMFLGFNSAAIVGVTLILLKYKKRTDYIPFGPFLAGATIVAYLYGSAIIHWYLVVGLQSYR